MTALTLFLIVLGASVAVYALTATVLIKVLRDRYRSVPAAHVTAAGAGIFTAGIGLLFVSGEAFWPIPTHIALVFGSVGAAIVNVGATMIVGPWLAGLVASDLRRVPIERGTRGTEAHLALSLVKLTNDYGGTVEYDHDGTYDFDLHFGRRDLRVELGALTAAPVAGDVVTNPEGWFRRIDALLEADPPTELAPVMIVVNDAMLSWLRSHDLGFDQFDEDQHLAFVVWNGSARDDTTLRGAFEALLFGITTAARRAAMSPRSEGRGQPRISATPVVGEVAD